MKVRPPKSLSYPIRLWALLAALLLIVMACQITGGSSLPPTVPTAIPAPGSGESGSGESGSGESGAEGGAEGGSGSGAEGGAGEAAQEAAMSSPITPLDQAWAGTLGGLAIAARYDAATKSVSATVENTTTQKLCYVQAEPHLKAGQATVGELGPVQLGGPAAGAGNRIVHSGFQRTRLG